jgi:hypothetical protein
MPISTNAATPRTDTKSPSNEGWCPICHSNLLLKGKPHWDGTSYPIECAMRGAGGSLTIEDGDPKFVVAEDGLKHCRTSPGRKNHFHEIMETHKQTISPKSKHWH